MESGTKFPSLKASNLEKEGVSIPRDLHGEYNIILVAFQQWHQTLIDDWVPKLKMLKEKYPEVDIYEFPTLKSSLRLMSFVIDGGMRFGIPSKKTREHTITLYLDKERFKKQLGIPTESTIYLYMVDKEGNILWSEAGTYSLSKYEKLSSLLEEITGS